MQNHCVTRNYVNDIIKLLFMQFHILEQINGTYSRKNGKIWKYTDLFYSVDITMNVLLRMFYTFYI